jgi:DNA-binding HxlR family transcriptional regulator
MARTSFADVACSIARAADVVGDAWTLLVLRDVLAGIHRFDDLAGDLGLSRKVLAARLALLVEEGLLQRVRYSAHPPRHEYRPTAKAADLYPVLLALMAWGDRWYSPEPPVRLRHRCGQETVATVTCAQCGEPLTSEDTEELPGPGGRVGPGTAVLGPLLAARDWAHGA